MSDFQVRLRQRNVSQIELVEDLKRVARELATTSLTRVQYAESGLFAISTFKSKFGSWNKALEAADLVITNRRGIADAELFENIGLVWMKLGRQPVGRDMSDAGTGSHFPLGTYKRRFITWNNALMEFVEFINSGNEDFGASASRATKSNPTRRTSRDIGWRLRAKILIRDSCICKMCGDSPAKNPDTVLHVDHILAWANGGETVEENLQTLCAKCNIGKSDAVFQ